MGNALLHEVVHLIQLSLSRVIPIHPSAHYFDEDLLPSLLPEVEPYISPRVFVISGSETNCHNVYRNKHQADSFVRETCWWGDAPFLTLFQHVDILIPKHF